MARIVYGVAGEGSGHASRAREIAAHLLDRGHDVRLVSYDRGYRNLKDTFRVLEVEGLRIASADNKVSVVHTFTENLRRLPAGHRSLQRLRDKLFKQFRPDCVITDFEPMTAYLAHHYDLPLVTIDNQHRMRYLRYDCPRQLKLEGRLTRQIIRAMVPRPDVSLVTAFCPGQARNDRTFVFPPIVRREVLQLKPTDGEHILVYLTRGFDSLLGELAKLRRERFMVYGYDRRSSDGVLHFKPFSRDGFLDDLAGCKAVMATAGFTLISEALQLRKPYLALPMQGQFEQQLNALQLEQMGFGKSAREPTQEVLGDFLYLLPDFRQRLREGYRPSDDNRAIKAKLDELLADHCRLARQFHERRKGERRQ